MGSKHVEGKYVLAEVQTIVLGAVSAEGSPENASFFAATPSGEIRLGTVNAEAARQFDLDAQFYVSFERAE